MSCHALQVKAAFTRAYNKDGHLSHYSIAAVAKTAARRSTLNSQSEYDDLEDEAGPEPELDSDSDGDLSSNPAIKVRKGSESSSQSSTTSTKKRKNGNQDNGAKKKRTKS